MNNDDRKIQDWSEMNNSIIKMTPMQYLCSSLWAFEFPIVIFKRNTKRFCSNEAVSSRPVVVIVSGSDGWVKTS